MKPKWPYNTRQWRKLRKMHLSEHPYCVYCMDVGKTTPGFIVDHIIPVREHPELAFDGSNLQSLCSHCHESIKKREEIRGDKIGFGIDGLPLGEWK